MSSNGSRLWRWKKIDILFLVGVGLIIYGAARSQIDTAIVGAGLCGIPFSQRGDKNL